MKTLLALACATALGLTALPPILFAGGRLTETALHSLMLAGMILWFPAAIGWDYLATRKK